MQLSIIIPYHSNNRLLNVCTSTLVETIPSDVEIILVKNNSDNKEISNETMPERIRNIFVNKNLGYSKAVNLGVANCSGDMLIIIDADTFYTSDWLSPLLSFHINENFDGLSSCKLLSPSSGRVIDFGMALTKFNNAHPFKGRPANHPLVAKTRRVQMACSACMMISRRLFEDIGGMDEDLHNFYQDTDLCLRLKEGGHPTWVVAESLVFHQGDSARTSRTPYKADVKAIYGAKNWHRMMVDMPLYFNEALEFFKSEGGDPCHGYHLVDLSSVADHDWHQDLIRSMFRIKEIHDQYSNKRDSETINLLNAVDVGLLTSSSPILYFVDSYTALRDNALWCDMRTGCGDVIVDRNANISFLEKLERY